MENMRAAAAQHGVAGTTSCGTQADEVVACDKRVKLVVHKEAFDGSPPPPVTLLSLPRAGLRLPEVVKAAAAACGSVELLYRLPGENELVLLDCDAALSLMLDEYDELRARCPRGGPGSRLHVHVRATAMPPASPTPTPRAAPLSWRASAPLRRKASRSPPGASPPGSAERGSEDMHVLAAAVVANVLDSRSHGGLQGVEEPARCGSPAAGGGSPAPSPASISADEMELGPRLGDGTYAVVHAGWWRGAAVAVKILRLPPAGSCAAASARAACAFSREASLLCRLQHPNVLALYGCVQPACAGVPPATILELMPHGSLRRVLRGRSSPPPLRTAAVLALGAARALQHLHAQAPCVVHFDIKADNLLVDWRDAEQPVCKLSDLGLAAPRGAFTRAEAAGRGTLWWMAPELFPGAPGGCATAGPEVDIFSFGVTVWEVLCAGADPYPPGTHGEAVMAAVRAGARPPLPAGLDVDWASLVNDCWATDPAARPAATQVVARLAQLARR